MANEVETKILNVTREYIEPLLDKLGAKKVLDTRYVVDWFRKKGISEGCDKWYLRIRTDKDGNSEVTWKGQSDILGAARSHREINFSIIDPEALMALFEEIDLEKYAHQEKDRVSWYLNDWRFDLDKYPDVPSYLEIEGEDELSIQKAIKLLELEKYEARPEGERTLIQNFYQLDWYNMKFNNKNL